MPCCCCCCDVSEDDDRADAEELSRACDVDILRGRFRAFGSWPLRLMMAVVVEDMLVDVDLDVLLLGVVCRPGYMG